MIVEQEIGWNPLQEINENRSHWERDYVDGTLTVASVIVEQVDWAMIAHDASQNGLQVEHTMALLPFLSHGGMRALDEGAEAFEQLSRRGEEVRRSISMDEALERADEFMIPGIEIRSYDQSSGVQFIQEYMTQEGDRITRRIGFDINPNSIHVQRSGPHLNLQVQLNGNSITSGYWTDPHVPIDEGTIILGDY